MNDRPHQPDRDRTQDTPGADLLAELLNRPHIAQRDDPIEPDRRCRPRRRRRPRRRCRLTAGGYPRSVDDVLDDAMTFKRTTLAALREFARSKPWRGSLGQRKRKFLKLRDALAAAYAIPKPRVRFRGIDGSGSGESSCRRQAEGPATITLRGRLSVVTFLHEFRHALGGDEWQATQWSANLFRRCFPRSFARCGREGHTLVRRDRTYTKEA